MSKKQPIDQQKIDLKAAMLETASKMTELAKRMLIYANALEEKQDIDTAITVRAKATELNGAARLLLDWHDALFPKTVTEE